MPCRRRPTRMTRSTRRRRRRCSRAPRSLSGWWRSPSHAAAASAATTSRRRGASAAAEAGGARAALRRGSVRPPARPAETRLLSWRAAHRPRCHLLPVPTLYSLPPSPLPRLAVYPPCVPRCCYCTVRPALLLLHSTPSSLLLLPGSALLSLPLRALSRPPHPLLHSPLKRSRIPRTCISSRWHLILPAVISCEGASNNG